MHIATVRESLQREDALNKKLCGTCTLCCEYVNVPIAPPKDEDDFDYLLWCLIHQNVYVWVGKRNQWNVKFMTPCKPLKQGRCSRYKTRPMLCREYSQDHCEKGNPTKDEVHAFHTQEQLLAYLRQKGLPFFGFYEEDLPRKQARRIPRKNKL